MTSLWFVGFPPSRSSARSRSLASVPWAQLRPAAPVRTLAAADQLESGVLEELNAIRRSHGLVPGPPLAASFCCRRRTLALHGRVRLLRARFARRLGVLEAHQTVLRLERLRQVVGRENLLWSSGRLEASAAVKLWMESPGHRANILAARWREVGLSAVSVPAAPGVFGGRNVVIITSDFGVRS